MSVCFDPFFCPDCQKLSCLGLSDDTLTLYSRASLRRRTKTNIYENTWFPNESWSLSQFDQSTELRSTALHWDCIFWNDTSVGMAQKWKLNAYVCIHFGWMSSWLNHWPSLVCNRKNSNSIARQTTREIVIKTLIETWLARTIDISSRRVGSCMSTITLDHTDNTIFTVQD